MSSLRQSPLPILQALSSSFTDLTHILAPLLNNQTYEQLNAALQANSSKSATTSTQNSTSDDELHGRLDAARMQVSVAYVLMDLVWILLKTKGVDPTNHPVMQELERVKSYFGKIKHVQDGEKEEANGTKLDRSAAGRFIRAALAGEPGSAQGTHTKFDDETANKDKVASKPKKVSEDKATPSKQNAGTTAAVGTPSSSNKKKRSVMDPFEGYDRPKTPKTAPATSTANETGPAASSPNKKSKKKKTSK
ncbi:related to LRP1 - nuclear exosome-associated nucleic acid binding protein [Melanopsichium pennsylvanicum]|uniref:Exosome complex protein n=2 Tax=Melanopsichium pennsylvanicum TaxID=63383 RepID=A0AAJ4XIS6_9BASI|nr:conserved hypothetical protein [Melanopsichium pennsylvanicum 4]SNX81908.1 related to LRP1 - nuclear exosome-associated nucleic acid binding protein [Melanopsichium pennsylvanicum]